MLKYKSFCLFLIVYIGAVCMIGATTLTITDVASTMTGQLVYKPNYISPQNTAALYNSDLNLAYSGNGYAKVAVAKDNIPGYYDIHRAEFGNDGYYGNGSSWISDSANSWIKIDLGRMVNIQSFQFGRDRWSGFDDRDPGQFIIEVASGDDYYLNGNSNNDSLEYTNIFSSENYGYSGVITGIQTVRVDFTGSITARFIKLTVANLGTAVDEIEVFGTVVPEVNSAWLIMYILGLAFFCRNYRQREN